MDTTKKKESARCCPGGWNCKVCGPRRKERRIIRKAVRTHDNIYFRRILPEEIENVQEAHMVQSEYYEFLSEENKKEYHANLKLLEEVPELSEHIPGITYRWELDNTSPILHPRKFPTAKDALADFLEFLFISWPDATVNSINWERTWEAEEFAISLLLQNCDEEVDEDGYSTYASATIFRIINRKVYTPPFDEELAYDYIQSHGFGPLLMKGWTWLVSCMQRDRIMPLLGMK